MQILRWVLGLESVDGASQRGLRRSLEAKSETPVLAGKHRFIHIDVVAHGRIVNEDGLTKEESKGRVL